MPNLNLEAVKARLAAIRATKYPSLTFVGKDVTAGDAADDIADLVAEVERLRTQWSAMKDEVLLCHQKIERQAAELQKARAFAEDEGLVERLAAVLAPIAWAAIYAGDTLAQKNRRTASLRHARAILTELRGKS